MTKICTIPLKHEWYKKMSGSCFQSKFHEAGVISYSSLLSQIMVYSLFTENTHLMYMLNMSEFVMNVMGSGPKKNAELIIR